jgi:hypothetical protein
MEEYNNPSQYHKLNRQNLFFFFFGVQRQKHKKGKSIVTNLVINLDGMASRLPLLNFFFFELYMVVAFSMWLG